MAAHFPRFEVRRSGSEIVKGKTMHSENIGIKAALLSMNEALLKELVYAAHFALNDLDTIEMVNEETGISEERLSVMAGIFLGLSEGAADCLTVDDLDLETDRHIALKAQLLEAESEEKRAMKMPFTALIALGVSRCAGAILEVSSHDADVRKMVLDDIAEDGDKQFIDALGAGLPKSGLIKVHAELVGWPSMYKAGEYRLISATTVLTPQLANVMATDVVAAASN